ncbi:MAG: Rieske 2Fe-2S domain-containing protein [Cyclobacteriaceae bacterium]
MGANYQAVLWNRQKKIYDGIMIAVIVIYLGSFVGFNLVFHPEIIPPTLIIRASGSLALIMLHIILVIGPLTRINRLFMPLLYNRRHLGVSMFLFALIHGGFSTLQFHAFGDINPILSIFISNTDYNSLADFPFQTLGFFALIILFLMAATSHDFWLHNLSARIWKSLHMMVYLAYGLIIVHVMLGVVQLESSPVLVSLLGFGLVVVILLHLWAGFKTRRMDNTISSQSDDAYVKVCRTDDIQNNQAKLFNYQDQSIAIFKYDGKVSAVANACKHQNGPLSEGRIIDGCITCPWHGYQYLPDNGTSPPPFQEKIATYKVKIIEDSVWVDPRPEPAGTAIPPATLIN